MNEDSGAAARESGAAGRREIRSYVRGAVLALALTAAAFAALWWEPPERGVRLWIIGVCALLQMIVHFRFFLHVGWRRGRDNLLLILFSALLLFIMVAGTIWIMGNLADRMMGLM